MAKSMKEDTYWSRKNLIFAFSNTGKEKPQTLDFVDRCDREFDLNLVWLEAKVNPQIGEGTTFSQVTYCTASRNGEPFESVTAKYGISNTKFPQVPGRQENTGSFWNRGNTSIIELVKRSRLPFIPVTDPQYKPTNEMDSESPCQCFRQDLEESAID